MSCGSGGLSKSESKAFGGSGPRLLIRRSSENEKPEPNIVSDALEVSWSLGSCLLVRDLSATEISEFSGETTGLRIDCGDSTWGACRVSLSSCRAWRMLSVIKFVSGRGTIVERRGIYYDPMGKRKLSK